MWFKWNSDEYSYAWNLASGWHGKQKMKSSDKISYLNHIGLVLIELTNAIFFANDDIDDHNLLIQAGILHDTIEDTGMTYTMLKDLTDKRVADGVAALSKNKSLPSEDQIKDSIERIKKQPCEIWMVKLADRITNLRQPPQYWTAEKRASYTKDSILIYNELGNASKFLKSRLKQKIVTYKKYK